MRGSIPAKALLGAIVVAVSPWTPVALSQDSGCGTGGQTAVTAYLTSNPFYASLVGDFDRFVSANRGLLVEGSPAVRCLAALSTALLRSSLQLYDPGERARLDELNARMGAMGIQPQRSEGSAADQAYAMSRRMARLARSLPAAANGDWQPWTTPASELESMEIMAEQLLSGVFSSAEMREVMQQITPMLREVLFIEFMMLSKQATDLAAEDCRRNPATIECNVAEARRAVSAGDLAGARRAFQRARALAPGALDLSIGEALIWYQAGHLSDAEQANRRALQLAPSSSVAHNNLAFVLFDLRRPGEALTHWEAALAAQPEDPDALAGRAIALQALGRAVEALASYRRAVALNADFLDCAVMKEKHLWSALACEAAAPLIQQVRPSSNLAWTPASMRAIRTPGPDPTLTARRPRAHKSIPPWTALASTAIMSP